MRKLLVLLVLVVPLLVPPAASASVSPTPKAGTLVGWSTYAAITHDRDGGVWAFDQRTVGGSLSLARISAEGAANDLGRATTASTVAMAYDDAADVLYYDDGGVVHRRTEDPQPFTNTVVGTFTALRGMDVAPDGSLYVADGDRIRRVAPDGTSPDVPGGTGLATLTGVAARPDGALLVLSDQRLWQVKDGARTPLTAAGDLGDPSSLDVAADGTVYVGEKATNRVRAITADGRIRTVVGGGRSCAEVTAAGGDCGVGGPAASAAIDQVTALTVSGENLYFVTRAGGTGLGHLFQVPKVATPASFVPGYRFIASDGGVFSYGAARFFGSTGGRRLNQPIVGGAAHGAGGYWLVAADGGIFSFGDAKFRGSTIARSTAPAVAMAAAGDSGGYWVVDRDGGIYGFGTADDRPRVAVGRVVAAASVGDAIRVVGADGRVQGWGTFDQSLTPRAIPGLKAPVVGVANTFDGRGYWLVTADGTVYERGSAPAYGSVTRRLNRPIVGLTLTSTGRGYWLVAADGGVFSFGDARFLGSTGSLRLNRPIVAAMAG